MIIILSSSDHHPMITHHALLLTQASLGMPQLWLTLCCAPFKLPYPLEAFRKHLRSQLPELLNRPPGVGTRCTMCFCEVPGSKEMGQLAAEQATGLLTTCGGGAGPARSSSRGNSCSLACARVQATAALPSSTTSLTLAFNATHN